MPMSNSYGNSPRPLGMGEEPPMDDRDRGLPESVPDPVAAMHAAAAEKERCARRVNMSVGG